MTWITLLYQLVTGSLPAIFTFVLLALYIFINNWKTKKSLYIQSNKIKELSKKVNEATTALMTFGFDFNDSVKTERELVYKMVHNLDAELKQINYHIGVIDGKNLIGKDK